MGKTTLIKDTRYRHYPNGHHPPVQGCLALVSGSSSLTCPICKTIH
ncbi:hypothetical protein [Echinicola rosea]